MIGNKHDQRFNQNAMPGLSCNCETMRATCELGSSSSETLAMLVLRALSVVAVGKLFLQPMSIEQAPN